MRKALVVLALVASFAAAGCKSSGGCQDSCAPKQECCWTWQPDCCNSWDWYVPCDLIEGRQYRTNQNVSSPCGVCR
jgi:hypothetical protein